MYDLINQLLKKLKGKLVPATMIESSKDDFVRIMPAYLRNDATVNVILAWHHSIN